MLAARATDNASSVRTRPHGIGCVESTLTAPPLAAGFAFLLRLCGGFAAFDGREIAVSLSGDGVLDEAHGTVDICELQTVGMTAAEGVQVRPSVVGIVESAVGRFFVPVRRHGGCSADAVGIGPSAMGVNRRNILAEHERVARAVG